MLTPEQYRNKRAEKRKRGEELGHIPQYIGDFMSDSYDCSCGFKGIGYWDGEDLAWDNWVKHIEEIMNDKSWSI